MTSVFSKIIAGEIPCEKIYEDDEFFAFLSIAPINKGHTIVTTKKVYEDFLSTPEDVLERFITLVKKLGAVVNKELDCDGINVATNNGYPAEVAHVHFHIIPRYKNDGKIPWDEGTYADGEIKEYGQRISKNLQ